MTGQEDRFEPAEGLPGKVFVPRGGGKKKHPCPDCCECQFCPDARCAACRKGSGAVGTQCAIPSSGGEQWPSSRIPCRSKVD